LARSVGSACAAASTAFDASSMRPRASLSFASAFFSTSSAITSDSFSAPRKSR
jgi:hypothetical protein